MIRLIVAMDRDRVIGVDGALPWRLPEDLKRFKRLTLGHPVIVGRKTFESLPGPLPGRDNIVVTRAPGYRAEGCVVVHDLDSAFASARTRPGGDEVWVIGGGEIYAQALERADEIHVTEVETRVGRGDARFPEIDPATWERIAEESRPADPKHAYAYRFVTWRRRRPPADESRPSTVPARDPVR